MSGWRGSALAVLVGLVAPGTLTAQGESAAGGAGLLTVSEAVRLALADHPSVGASRAELREADAAIGEAKAAWLPRLTADGSLTRFQEPMIVAPLHGFDFRRPPDFDRNLVQGELALGFTLFDGGARSAGVRAARATRGAREAGLGAAEMTLILRVVEGYARVLTARDVLAAQHRRIEALTSERERARRMLEAGRAARVELLRADAALSSASADRIEAEERLRTATRSLARLTGLDEGAVAPESMVEIRAGPATDMGPRGPELEAAIERSPEVRRARERLRVAEEGRRVARAAWLPRLDLAAGLLSLGSVNGDFTTEWRTGVALSYPLFTGGGRASAVSRATAGLEAAREDLREARLEARESADRAAARIRATGARADALRAAAEHLEEVARIEKLALDTGAGVQTDYLRAEADLLEARTARSDAGRDRSAARTELARLLGILDPNWVTRNLEEGR
ncbi:MAG: TolC family protein [Gemmatimonadota bacterium]